MIKTFNAIGLWQLNQSGVKTRKLIKEFDAKRVIMHGLSDIRGDINVTDNDVTEFQQKISAIKASRTVRNSGDIKQFPDWDEELEQVYEYYQSYLEKGNLMDFSDQVSMATHGLVEGNIKPIPYTHLLVDEYQDSDEIQVDWTILHANAGKIVTVVGDDDQSIYRFRGGSGYEAFRYFEANAPDVKRVVLNINYRSYQEILDTADRVIKCNQKRIAKKLVSHNGNGGQVKVVGLHNPTEEIIWIAQHLKQSMKENPGESWAILTRVNIDLFRIEQALSDMGIPYLTNSKINPIKTKLPKAYLGLLERFEDSPEDAVFDMLTLFGIRHDDIAYRMETLGIDSIMDFCNLSDKNIEAMITSMTEDAAKNWKTALSLLSGYESTVFRWRHGQISSKALLAL
ncbi:MAG TPA: ATP-dependent helicase [Syntrophaceae bacterium]|nr:ATP-dependent helicase [Syntrophaceae bacterium]